MPSEAARLSRPVGPRDRRFFGALAVLAAAGTSAGVLLFGHGGGARTARCLAYDQAGVLGGGTWHLCGADAAAFCKVHARKDETLAAKCDALMP